jgi:hypothetical protein
MAARSYAIPDLDNDDETESPNLFSKRQKTDNSSTINETTSVPSNTIHDAEPSSNYHFSHDTINKI